MREIEVVGSADQVAETLARRLVQRLAQIQRAGRVPQVALTGGRIATQAYQRLAAEGPASGVDWTRVELWWGDERFVPADDADRNAKQALDLLNATLPLEPERVHPMPASDSGAGLDAAALAYQRELGDTVFDVCLLGVGPDGHVASLFPDHPSSTTPGAVIPVRSSPKPPPERISLTREVINRSREVWLVVSGADKADAVRQALAGDGDPVPAGSVAGTDRTLWLLDRDAASRLPGELT